MWLEVYCICERTVLQWAARQHIACEVVSLQGNKVKCISVQWTLATCERALGVQSSQEREPLSAQVIVAIVLIDFVVVIISHPDVNLYRYFCTNRLSSWISFDRGLLGRLMYAKQWYSACAQWRGVATWMIGNLHRSILLHSQILNSQAKAEMPKVH